MEVPRLSAHDMSAIVDVQQNLATWIDGAETRVLDEIAPVLAKLLDAPIFVAYCIEEGTSALHLGRLALVGMDRETVAS